MKIGDLVLFKPEGGLAVGALTAIKYYERIRQQSNGLSGIIVSDNGDSCVVAFGEKNIVINKHHLEVINGYR
jgi:hypothetical protein